MNYVVEEPALDYITVTDYTGNLAKLAWGLARYQHREDESIMSYQGGRWYWVDGSMFCGVGLQSDLYHCMVQVTGSLADKFGHSLLNQIFPLGKGRSNCSRVDLQYTERGMMDLQALANRLTSNDDFRRQVVTTTTHQGGRPGTTLYIGSPSSDKRIRIYHKDLDYTRFEIQFRRQYAVSFVEKGYMAGLGRELKQIIAAYLWGELEMINDRELGVFFSSVNRWADGETAVPQTARTDGESDTKKWIKSQVMPSLLRQAAIDKDFGNWCMKQIAGVMLDNNQEYR